MQRPGTLSVQLLIMALLCAVLSSVVFLTVVFFSDPSTAANAEDNEFGWFQWCEYSDTGHDDPIVYPGQPGASHRHVEYGMDFNAYSTRAKLMATPGECFFEDGTQGGNHSAYWVQDIKLRDGTYAGGVFSTAYYTSWPGAQLFKMEAPPKGIKAVVRDVPGAKIKWACGGRGGGMGGSSNYPHDCDPTSDRPYVSANFVFPSCSDGRKDSADHISHLAFPRDSGRCPASHPTPIPRLRMGVRYDTFKGADARMASMDDRDPSRYAHADYFNAWNEQNFDFLLKNCIKAQVKCWRKPSKVGF